MKPSFLGRRAPAAFISWWFPLLLAVIGFASPSAQPDPKKATARAASRSIAFEDITHPSGIDFRSTCGSPQKRFIMEAMCGGVALFDYDNDGWPDILFVNGSSLEDLRAENCHSSKLYRNLHNGKFAEVTASAGLSYCGWGFGVAVGDYDNDSWEDLYITGLRGGTLFHNDHGHFTDVTKKSGADDASRWGTSAAFGDYDHDGYLDLYIANYVDLDLEHLPVFGSNQFCQYRGIPVSCGPRGLKGSRDRLYRNNGNGTFTDVTEKLGIDTDEYYGLGVMWLDYDLDGCLDVYVANDSSPSLLYKNNCQGAFTEVAVPAGVAFSGDGKPQAGMGVDSADYDHDGLPDIAKTNFSDDTNNLYHNDGGELFTDRAGPTGFGPVSIPFLGFGIKFLDLDDDGWPDIVIANGHVNPQVDGHGFGVTYAERPLVFRNNAGRMEEIGLQSGNPIQAAYQGRGLASADLFNDGGLEIVITQVDGPALLLRRAGPPKGNWIRIKTTGSPSNRDGFGARVEVRAAGNTWWQEVRANSSYLSASDPRLHFGLGSHDKVESIVVHWPSGATDRIGPQSAGHEIRMKEGNPAVAEP